MAKDNNEKETLEETSEETAAETSADDVEASAEDNGNETVSDKPESTSEEVAEEAAAESAEESEEAQETQAADDANAEEAAPSDEDASLTGEGSGDATVPPAAEQGSEGEGMKGIAAYFDLPDDLMLAAAHTRDSKYDDFEAYSPFPIHGMDDAMGLGRSWIPWVTFGAGSAGFLTANALQFFTMSFDWPMIVGGKPFAPWPSFVPIMFELTVLFAGVTTAIVMLIAAGCFRKPFIIDPEITKDRFVLWISADDDAFDPEEVRSFLEGLNPVEIRTITKGA
ncbi:hypothetical protein DL240_12170 [Lujinxingia litoralis]|uniref:DUF3341 domain-containing protein n=1 Tax=Lujinxingia litoralis TaxID=2211119 RepID=A0A328C8B7_9DELT|nr:DUF3341 domain-containing protein [Lujinxingia litoralis]RAL21606.1 hypothetical protein DL240_12170 [Lujinxingia litoralis]